MELDDPLRMTSRIRLAGDILLGIDSLNQLGDFASQYTRKSALVISDNTLKRVGTLEKVEDQLTGKNIPYDVFTDVDPDPSIECATEVAQTARKKEYSLIIGVGGGSSLDMAKVASAMITNQGDVSDYIGVDLLKNKGVPLILIPTTSGTGSEVTANAIVSSKTDLMKKGIVSLHIFPTLAIVDPTLTASCPPKLTAYTGLDALSHNIEGLMSLRANPFHDTLGLKAVGLIFKYLPVAYSKGSNLEARYHMALASLFGGMVIQGAGTCGGHAAAYAFAVKHNIPHGISCALVLPYLMEFNSISCPEKIAAIGEALPQSEGYSVNNSIKIAIKSVLDLMRQLDIPTSLKEIGIQKKDLADISKDIFKAGRLLINNPRQLSEKDSERLFNKMWEGKID